MERKIVVALFCLLCLVLSACAAETQAQTSATPTAITTTTATAALTPSATPTQIPTLPIPTATEKPTETPVATSIITHTVAIGDTLESIATKYGSDMFSIALENGLEDMNLIYVGQVLTIPDSIGPIDPFKVTSKHILVVLSNQEAFAYDGEVLVNQFSISSGLEGYETVTGDFFIYIKLSETRMTGPGYDIPDVPWTMYFHQGYGLHGAYWHDNFGQPMSHGCVNMKVEDAKWLFNWAPLGTSVKVIP